MGTRVQVSYDKMIHGLLRYLRGVFVSRCKSSVSMMIRGVEWGLLSGGLSVVADLLHSGQHSAPH